MLIVRAFGLLATLGFDDGTSVLPSIKFKSQPAMGFYRSAAGKFGVSDGMQFFLPAGYSATPNSYVPMGSIHADPTQVGTNADLVEKRLIQHRLPANTVGTSDAYIHVVAWVKFAANGNGKTATLKFGPTGGEAVLATITGAYNNLIGVFEAWVVKTGANAQKYIVRSSVNNGTAPVLGVGTTAWANTATMDFNVYGQNAVASANDVLHEWMTVEYDVHDITYG